MTTDLNRANLGRLQLPVRVPAYDVADVRPGIVHLGLGGFHLATAAAGTIPPRGDLPRAVARRWLRHGGTVAGITLAVWLLALSFDAIDSAPNAALASAGLLVVAVGGFMLSAGSHTGDR